MAGVVVVHSHSGVIGSRFETRYGCFHRSFKFLFYLEVLLSMIIRLCNPAVLIVSTVLKWA